MSSRHRFMSRTSVTAVTIGLGTVVLTAVLAARAPSPAKGARRPANAVILTDSLGRCQ